MKHLRTRLSAGPESRRSQAAFSMIEVVVGMGVVALTVGALYTGMAYGMGRTNFAREDLRASQIMLEKMEQLRLYRWDQVSFFDDPDDLDDPDFDPEDPHVTEDELSPFIIPTTFTAALKAESTNQADLIYQGTVTITNAPVTGAYSNNLLLVTVGVTWQSGSQTRSRQMQTLFAKYGIQNNVPK